MQIDDRCNWGRNSRRDSDYYAFHSTVIVVWQLLYRYDMPTKFHVVGMYVEFVWLT